MLSKHEKEIEDFKIEFEEKWNQKNPGCTPSILHRIRTRDILSKNKCFKEAQVIQNEIDALKDEHLNNWNTKIKQKCYNDELKKLKNKQNIELNCLRDKLKMFQEKFEVKMKTEDQKFKNVYDVKEKKLLGEIKRKKGQYFKYTH